MTEKDQTEQMQQMLDSEEQETTLKVLVSETYDSLTRTNSEKMFEHINEIMGKNGGTTFLPLKQ